MKILYFDYWTRGIHNFARIDPLLKNRGHRTRLLHLGSLREPGIQPQEIRSGIECRDISYYTGNIGRALYREHPDILLGLNYSHTMDRVINRLAKQLGVKTAYMMHGARATEREAVENLSTRLNHSIGVGGRLRRVPAYFRIMYWYFRTKGREHPTWGRMRTAEIQYLIQMLTKPGEATLHPPAHPDLWWDLALVYSRRYTEFLTKQIGYSNCAIREVGSPELDYPQELIKQDERARVGAGIQEIGIDPHFKDGGIITWIDEAVVEMGLISEDDRVREIEILAQSARENGYDLVIKLHPNTNSRIMEDHFHSYPHIHLVRNIDNSLLMLHSTAVFGRGSTLLLIPVILGKPLFELAMGSRRSRNYRSILEYIQPDELGHVLENPVKRYFTPGRQELIKLFIESDIGPVDGSAVQRIADCLEELGASQG